MVHLALPPPVARAAEILAERWTPLVIRNLLWGATTFSDIAQGVPTMSRSMLIKRLADLQRVGIVQATPRQTGRGSLYTLTPAGRDLASVIDTMAAWGTRWLEATSAHSDLRPWLRALGLVSLPHRPRPTASGPGGGPLHVPPGTALEPRFWLLVDQGTAEMCHVDPGGELDAEVIAGSHPFTRWHRGNLPWSDALRSGDITITGRAPIVRALPTWNTHSPDLTAMVPASLRPLRPGGQSRVDRSRPDLRPAPPVTVTG